jgi:hypothetical protein
MFTSLKKLVAVVGLFAISFSALAGTAIKRAVVIDGKTYEKWVMTEQNVKTIRIIDPASDAIIKETVVEVYDDDSVVSTFKELNESKELVVVRIKYSTVDKKTVNNDGSVTYQYKDVTKTPDGKVVSTGTTTTTQKTVVDGKTGTTTTTTSSESTTVDGDGNESKTSEEVSTETDSEGNTTETVKQTDESGSSSETVTVTDSDGESKSETTNDDGESGSVDKEAGEQQPSGDSPSDDGSAPVQNDPRPGQPYDDSTAQPGINDGSGYDNESNN